MTHVPVPLPRTDQPGRGHASDARAAGGRDGGLDRLGRTRVGAGLLDFGTPLDGGVRVAADGSTSPSTREVAGYSLVEAADLAAALELAKGHPHLDMPGAARSRSTSRCRSRHVTAAGPARVPASWSGLVRSAGIPRDCRWSPQESSEQEACGVGPGRRRHGVRRIDRQECDHVRVREPRPDLHRCPRRRPPAPSSPTRGGGGR